MSRGLVYIPGLVALFIVTAVVALAGVQGLSSRLTAPVGGDALAISKANWDAEGFVLYIEESVRRAECDALPEVVQRISTSLSAEQSSLARVDPFILLDGAVRAAVPARVGAYMKQHPFGPPIGFFYSLDVDNRLILAIAESDVELRPRVGKREVGVYSFRPDVSAPLVYELDDIDVAVRVIRDVREKCHAQYPKTEGADACILGVLPSGFSAKRADASTVIVSAPFRASCPSQVSLDMPLTVSAAQVVA